MVAQSMGFPSCFIFSIRAFICSRLMSFGCSIKRKIVGRWFLLWQATRGRAGLPVTFYFVLLGSSMRFDKRKEIKEKKQEEGQVSLSYLWNDPLRIFWVRCF